MESLLGGGLQSWSPAPQADTLSLVSRPDSSQLHGVEKRHQTQRQRPAPS